MKMFQPEFRKQGLKFEYCIDESYKEHGVSWVMADLARVAQILVNLVSAPFLPISLPFNL